MYRPVSENPAHVVCVDDDPANLGLMRTLLEGEGYSVTTFASGAAASEFLGREEPDLILSDLRMPGVSGFDLLEWVRAQPRLDGLPFVLITAAGGGGQRLHCLHAGADDFLSKPLVPAEVLARVAALLRMRRLAQQVERQNVELRRKNVDLELAVRTRTAELDRLTRGLVAALEHANLLNDHDTGNHIQRVCSYSGLLADALGMGSQFVTQIERYAGLHDVGKVSIPDHILKKEGRLTRAEWTIMQTHSEKGFELLRAAGMPQMAQDIARHHHEWWNGKGYPMGLVGAEIPMAARIVAVADAFDALTTPRCYKPAFPMHEAEKLIERESGRHYDPDVVDRFRKCRARIRNISLELRDPGEVLVGEPMPSEVALMAVHPDGSVDDFDPDLVVDSSPG